MSSSITLDQEVLNLELSRNSNKIMGKQLKKYLSFLVHTLFGSYRNTIFVVAFSILGVGYVMVRMSGVEQDYELHKLNLKYQQVNIRNKELKADRASLYSAERLKKLSATYNLSPPRQDQVIVISE